MSVFLRKLFLAGSALAQVVCATPEEAKRIEQSYDAAVAQWSRKMAATTTLEARKKVAAERPGRDYAAAMWRQIGPALAEDWTLEPAAWFIEIASGIGGAPAGNPNQEEVPTLVFKDQLADLRAVVAERYMANPKLVPVCLAYGSVSDPGSFALLEKIEKNHKDPAVRGVAALALAIRLRGMGDTPELLSRRLRLLRSAIIGAADVQSSGKPITPLIEDELYIVKNLTKGRDAPALSGVDSGGRPLDLRGSRGKVTVLLFWDSSVADLREMMEGFSALRNKSKDKPFAVIGINGDTVENLRTLQKEDAGGLLDFPNFSDPRGDLAKIYRVGARPVAFVLDREHRIQYAGPPTPFMYVTIAALLSEKAPGTARPQ